MNRSHTLSFILFVFAFTGNSVAENKNQLKIGITSSLNKVYQSRPFNFKGHFSHQAEIELALNEYEATQIVLFPETDFTDITANAGTLIHENKIDTLASDLIQSRNSGEKLSL